MRVYVRLRIAKVDAIKKITELQRRFNFLHDVEQGFCEDDRLGAILIYGSFPKDQMTAVQSHIAIEVLATSLS